MSKPKAFSSIRITGEPGHVDRHVFIDGKEIRGVKHLTIDYSPANIPLVTMEIMTLDLEVEEPGAVIRTEGEEE